MPLSFMTRCSLKPKNQPIRHYTNEWVDQGIWWALDKGIKISDENVPEKYNKIYK